MLNGINLPEFVKEAEMDELEQLQYLEKEAFADEYNRAFPINTPARVYVSNAFFLSKKAQLTKKWGKPYVDKIANKIAQAGKLFNIETDLTSYVKQAATKTIVPEPEHLCAIKIGEAELDLFPSRTAEELTKSAINFANNIGNFPFHARKEISELFAKRAEQLNLEELPTIICKYAAMYFPDVENLVPKLAYRSTKIASEQGKKQYNELIDLASQINSLEDAYKVAEIAFHIEQNEGVYDNVKVASVIGDPVDALFTLSFDKVASILNVVEMAGEVYPVESLKKISSDVYKEAFGIDINPSDEGQLRDVLPTMPLSDVTLFKELSGVQPIA